MMLLWSPILPCATIEPRTSTQTRSAISDVMSAWSYGGLTCATESDGSAFVVCESVGGGGWRAPRRCGGRVPRAHLDDLHPAEALGGDEADHLQGLARQEAAGLGPPRPRHEPRLRGGGRCGVRCGVEVGRRASRARPEFEKVARASMQSMSKLMYTASVPSHARSSAISITYIRTRWEMRGVRSGRRVTWRGTRSALSRSHLVGAEVLDVRHREDVGAAVAHDRHRRARHLRWRHGREAVSTVCACKSVQRAGAAARGAPASRRCRSARGSRGGRLGSRWRGSTASCASARRGRSPGCRRGGRSG